MNPINKRIRTEVSNPGPGALSSVRIHTSIIDHKNNNEHINSETATISIILKK